MSEAKRKAWYQPWDEEAFRADLQVMRMTPPQRSKYRALLQGAFVHSTRPYLPDDDAVLWMIADCVSRDDWEKDKDVVRAAFTAIELDGARLLSRKRLVDDWNRIVRKRRALAKAGAKGGRAKAKPDLAEPSKCLADVKEGQAAVNQAGQVKPAAKGFDEFWKVYPRKEAKQDARAAWRKVKPEEVAAVLKGLQRAIQSEQWLRGVIPHPATWLNGRRWEDEAAGSAVPAAVRHNVSEIPLLEAD